MMSRENRLTTEEQGDNYVNGERIDMELERAVGRVVRAFDPCISCATH